MIQTQKSSGNCIFCFYFVTLWSSRYDRRGANGVTGACGRAGAANRAVRPGCRAVPPSRIVARDVNQEERVDAFVLSGATIPRVAGGVADHQGAAAVAPGATVVRMALAPEGRPSIIISRA